MKIATWNVNSLNVRLTHVLDWLQTNPVDVLCLQELKLTDDRFPVDAILQAGYRSWFIGQKAYNGVAILVKKGLVVNPEDCLTAIPEFEDPQKRIIALTVNQVRIVCAYFPNGQALDSEKFIYKRHWLHALHTWLTKEIAHYPKFALLGDFNIAPEDRDVYDPVAYEGKNLVSPQERQAFQSLIDLGLVDAFRQFEQEEKAYSWWDYRSFAFRRNLGLRIDHILLSSPLATQCQACIIDKTPRKWEKPSDHTPVIATLNLA